MSGAARGLARVVWTSIKLGPAATALCLLETAAQFLHVFQPLFLGWFVAGLANHNSSQLVQALAGFVASLTFSTLLRLLGISTRIKHVERVGHEFDLRIASATARIPTLDHLESTEFLDRTQLLRDHKGVLGGTFNQLVSVVTSLSGAVATVALAVTIDWRLALVIVASLPRLVLTRWTNRWAAEAEEASAAPARLTAQLSEILLRPSAAGEIRVLALSRTLRTRLGNAVDGWLAPGVRLSVRMAWISGVQSLVFHLAACTILVWLTHDVVEGTTGVAVLAAAVMIIGRLSGVVAATVAAVGTLGQLWRTAARFEWLHRLAAGEAGHAPLVEATHVAGSIVVDNVSYSYPEAESPALREVTLTIPEGATVALVGPNGAGKTTLVKLLCGLYLPSAGRITIGDLDLAGLGAAAWQPRLSAAFQDYLRLELTVQESVGVGDHERMHDQRKVRAAIGDARATPVLDALPHGLSTQLGQSWAGGVDLSSGQWQRLALARAMMRAGPRLLVLDEPTAALDAEAEHELFEYYAALTRRGRRQGTSTILVTHRFTSAAVADTIVVLDGGRITEIGSHEELLRTGKTYARLYRMQSSGYR